LDVFLWVENLINFSTNYFGGETQSGTRILASPCYQCKKTEILRILKKVLLLSMVAEQLHHKAKVLTPAPSPHSRTGVQILLGSRVLRLEIPGENNVLVVSHHVVKWGNQKWRTTGPPHPIEGAPG